MSFPEPRTSRDVLDTHWDNYQRAIYNGEVQPWLYPQSTLGMALVILYLVAPRNSFLGSEVFKYTSLGVMTYYHVWIILNCKSASMSTGYGIGIVSAFAFLLSASFLVFNNAKQDFKRVESKSCQRPTSATNGGPAALRPVVGNVAEYFWQPFPSDAPFLARLDWVQDLFSSFRGVGWNFETSWVPKFPQRVQLQLQPQLNRENSQGSSASDAISVTDDTQVTKNGVRRFNDPKTLLKHAAWLFAQGYIGVDLVKTVISRDRYFWGMIEAPAPDFLPDVIRTSWVLTRTFRLLVSMTGIFLVLRSIFTIAPLYFVGVLGRSLLGARGEAWLYPDHWGNFASIMDRGLAGFWGGWWHQTFRFGFTAFSSWVLRTLRLDPKGPAGKITGTFAVFFVSGLLHASGSNTQIAKTSPWQPFTFFMLQPVALLLEQSVKNISSKAGISQRVPSSLGRVINFIWVFTWLFFTAPLLVDDFARGGVWLWEPPGMISVFRGLGFGSDIDGWINWRVEIGRTIRWHSDPGGRWWMSGWAL